ncbi:Rtt106-domain-containing protein [Xylona heveae TC161]|uniref:Rtt106-domain-containing protein n=1 Tax=Xylona heveae (strain CBS 132557 / TC161) TaxID=1328760 RepID=A0A165J5T9_XYLHT|nr:Rtt106-domain-containing protein [Xylona heveae TC161]KZF25771.1 Rtt106-domain-containing protein [Xylona heveae TC161]
MAFAVINSAQQNASLNQQPLRTSDSRGSSAPRTKAYAQAFGSRSDILNDIVEIIRSQPQQADLFDRIAAFTIELQGKIPSSNGAVHQQLDTQGPSSTLNSKKRKAEEELDKNALSSASANGDVWKNTSLAFSSKDISFSVPLRKKMTLEVSGDVNVGIRAINQASGEQELSIAWKSIETIICLPVPEKAQRQHNFCVFPTLDAQRTASPAEPIVWTVTDAPIPKNATPEEASQHQSSDKAVTSALNQVLSKLGKKVIYTDENEFASALVQPHRKHEKAYHVKAFRGNKDGYLFFLSTGIVWGFKKPLVFFPLDCILSVSYTSVLQRTFNLVISASTPITSPSTQTPSSTQTDEAEEIEFSMLDQADFPGIDEYIRRHQLHDASMAEQRRAKRLNINGAPSGGSAAGPKDEGQAAGDVADEGEEESELVKAQRQIEDEEDEEEEDYDPGSEGESEGEGSSSSEEEDEEEGDLVEEELGSEAEMVDADDE